MRVDYSRYGKLNTSFLLFLFLQLSFALVKEKITVVLAGKLL